MTFIANDIAENLANQTFQEYRYATNCGFICTKDIPINFEIPITVT